jgi:hypothetical protein
VIKKICLLPLIFIGLLLFASCLIYVPYPEEYPPSEEEQYYEREYRDYPSGYDTSYFYDYLSPHGMWVYHSPYGYVWIPRIYRYGWRPYSYGSWIWTDFGWTWISDWEWGWIAFHYGRWGWDDYLGWYWIPDTVWGPAWVTWRRSSLFIGWAPLPPDVRFIPGIGIRSVTYRFPGRYWIFVEYPYFYRTPIYRYILPVERNRTIINDTIHKTNIVNRDRRVINEGIDRDYIQRRTGETIVKHRLKDADRARKTVLRADELQIFRPTIRKNDQAKPKTVVRREEVKDKLARSRIKKIEDTPGEKIESTLLEFQTRELTILKKSQQKEIAALKRKSKEEKEAAKTAAEKLKIEKKTQVKISDLKKKHSTEESKLKNRHKEEKVKTKVKKIKKKKKIEILN